VAPSDRLRKLVAQIEQADQVGLDVFGVGEHYLAEYLDSAPAMIPAAAAARTSRIRLTIYLWCAAFQSNRFRSSAPLMPVL
jgi:alkanesulfonate monooxygenase SsuD/methylene tetrahydromethanopterin reductase-like flavin-dependent oxidoreductase (luciferase family)